MFAVVPTGALLGSGGSMSIGTLHDSHINTQGSMQYSPSSENGGIFSFLKKYYRLHGYRHGYILWNMGYIIRTWKHSLKYRLQW